MLLCVVVVWCCVVVVAVAVVSCCELLRVAVCCSCCGPLSALHGGQHKTACQGVFMFISLTVASVS